MSDTGREPERTIGAEESNERLMTCPDCGKPVSKLAFSCPNCGRPLRDGAEPKQEIKIENKKEGSTAGAVICAIIGILLMILGFSNMMKFF